MKLLVYDMVNELIDNHYTTIVFQLCCRLFAMDDSYKHDKNASDEIIRIINELLEERNQEWIKQQEEEEKEGYYLVVDKTNNTSFKHKGDFPNLEEILNRGDDIIVLSYYSNTIKIPFKVTLSGVIDWEWKEFKM